MLRAAACIAGFSLLASGCLWEPVEQAPVPGNGDVAPVIRSAFPSNNQIFLSDFENDPCVAQVSLPSVFSPRAAPLKASFFLNFDPTASVEPLSIGNQTQFDLQVSEVDSRVFTLRNQQIHVDDFIDQFNGQTNVLLVFVSDDLTRCPDPTAAVQPSSDSPTLACYTTSWAWVIEPSQCPVLDGL
jgi:hypothetical protein